MPFYEEQSPMHFYGGPPGMMLPPIVGLGMGKDGGPVTVNPALPALQAAAMSQFGPSISPGLSSLVMGMTPGTTSSLILGIPPATNTIATNALAQFYQQQQQQHAAALGTNGTNGYPCVSLDAAVNTFPYGNSLCSNGVNGSSNGSSKSAKSSTSSESRSTERKARNGGSNSNSTCGSNGSNSGAQLSSGEGESDTNEPKDASETKDGRASRELTRREYHKKIERKRRDRTRSLYDELRNLTSLNDFADKNAVLQGAIALIEELKQQNMALAGGRRPPDGDGPPGSPHPRAACPPDTPGPAGPSPAAPAGKAAAGGGGRSAGRNAAWAGGTPSPKPPPVAVAAAAAAGVCVGEPPAKRFREA